MKKKMRIDSLVRGLMSAIAANDWKALDQADREVASVLSALGTVAEAGAAYPELQLQELRHAHQQAQQHCARELEKLGQHLKELGEHKEGFIAYALNSKLEEAKA